MEWNALAQHDISRKWSRLFNFLCNIILSLHFIFLFFAIQFSARSKFNRIQYTIYIQSIQILSMTHQTDFKIKLYIIVENENEEVFEKVQPANIYIQCLLCEMRGKKHVEIIAGHFIFPLHVNYSQLKNECCFLFKILLQILCKICLLFINKRKSKQ